MFVKFEKSINEYKYLISFDLASKITGVCIWDINNKKPLNSQVICVSNQTNLPVMSLYLEIEKFFNNLYKQGIRKEDIIVSFEAVPSQIRAGKSSTIQTFVALARSHAILDLYLFMNEIATYDETGIYPITTHAYFKHLVGLGKDDKVTKEDIKKYLVEKYSISNSITLDESDAIFLAETLIGSKWNKDIEEEIRNVKRHKKTLKVSHAIQKCDDEIERLENLKI